MNEGAAVIVVADFQPPLVFVHDDVVGDAHAQARALTDLLGGEERLEHAVHLILGKPGTVVPDDAVHHAVGDVGHDRDVSLAFPAGRCDRLGGVYQHVQEYLVELAEVAADRWNETNAAVDRYAEAAATPGAPDELRAQSLFELAALARESGDTATARQALDQLQSRYGGSIWADRAGRLMESN